MRARLVLALLVCAVVVRSGAAQEVPCENERGEYYSLPLWQHRAGERPFGPCNPPGTWERLNRDLLQQRRRERERSSRRWARAYQCVDCLRDGKRCEGIEKLKCWEYQWAESSCSSCREYGIPIYCEQARRIRCPDLAHR